MKPKFSVLIFALLLLLCSLVRAQQDQTHDTSNPEDIWPQNSEWTNGWSAGYWVTCTSGLSCAVTKGTCFDSSHTRHAYGGGTISVTNATNYIDLKDSDCSIEISTSAYQSWKHLATVVASAGTVSTVTNDRSWFTFALTGAGNLTPLFTTSISGSTLNFSLSNAAANTVFGNFSASSGAPSYNSVTACGDSTHALSWIAGTGFGCQAFTIPSGTVTSIATTSPITGGTITATGTIACASCVTASSPGLGYAHFAGSTQAATSVTIPRGLSFTIGDPAGSALTVASTTTDYLTVPFGCTISAYNLVIDAGTITVKFWRKATGTAIPTSSDSISTSGVSISSGTAIHSTTTSDFTSTTVTANDIIAMNVTAVSSAKFVNGVLQCDESQ